MRTIKSVVLVLLCAAGFVVHTTTASSQPAGPAAHTQVQVAAAGSSKPVLGRPVTRRKSLTFKGRARPHARVRLQVRAGDRWVVKRTVRTDRRGRFGVRIANPKRTRSYRVVVNRRASAVRRVERKSRPKPPPAPVDACGTRPARPDGSYYECTFVEQFAGTELDPTRWLPQHMAGAAGDACYINSPETVRVADGVLRLSARPAEGDLQCPQRADGTRGSVTGGWVSTYRRWGQQYGRFEARIKVSDHATAGLHEAFWLWPDVRTASDREWPASGEIDIMETYSQYPDLVVPFLHYNEDDNGGPVDGLNTAWNCPSSRGEWHTYGLVWTADRLTITVDGKTCLVNTHGAESFRKEFIINLTQALGTGTNLYRSSSVPLPATMEVDYVKVWR
ncbi:glycoside hydrolase family 16 protein [Nocardioides sp. SYSU DS0651]|uniref:glycoside hydrolase family 16 protein n=1 Tax=Nocardioides sp. SYSU DS0651 TaxID=3415955 RepID=UPI003F4C1688